MTFLQLQYFKVVAYYQNITRAAEVLGLSPAALSHTIKQLEQELGTTLFDHSNRGTTLNERGAIFLEHVLEVQNAMETASQRLHEQSEEQGRLLRVRFDAIVGNPARSTVEFKRAHPDIILNVSFLDRAFGQYDLGFIQLPFAMDDPGMVHICSERYTAIVSSESPHAAKSRLTLGELRDEPFIMLQEPYHQDVMREMCGAAGFVPSVSMAFGVSAIDGVHDAVASGFGCAIVPERTWSLGWGDGAVRMVPIADIKRSRHVYCRYAPDAPLSEPARLFIDFVRENLQAVPVG